MRFIHLVFAILAVWRITELFTMDKITEKLRQRFPWYLWTCLRCLSVWAGVFCAVAFVFFPYLNWPFAFSYLYFVHNDFIVARRQKQRRLVVEVNQQGMGNIVENTLAPGEIASLLESLLLQHRPNVQS